MEYQTDLGILNRAPLFCDVPPEILEEVRAAGFLKHVHPHDVVFHQGDEAAIFYLILDGRLRATQSTPEGDQVIIGYFGPADVVGYAVLSGDSYHPSTVTSVIESRLLGWPRAYIRQIAARRPEVAMNALTILGRRYHEMQQRLREFSTQGVERRIAHTVLRLARQAGRRTSRGIEIAFPLLRQDLAEMTGATLHTASRTLSAWENRGIVASARRRIIVHNMNELARIAGEEG
jgi:CRP-like cAMP-binding protein